MDKFNYYNFTDGDVSLDVRVSHEDNTIWLSANEMATLFNVDATTIRRIIKSTYNIDKLTINALNAKNASIASMVAHSPKKKPFYVYGLDVIKTVGERLDNDIALKLETFLQKGNSSNDNRDMIIYNNGPITLNVSVSPKEETVWLSQNQISLLFETTISNVSMHIKNILEEGELDPSSVIKDFLHTAPDGKQYSVSFYNLDMILAIGYRIKGKRAVEFRKWATKILKDYLINGAAISNKSDDAVILKSVINLNNEYLDLKNEINQLRNDLFKLDIKERVFYNGEYFDAYCFIVDLLLKAKHKVIIIDPYFDYSSLAYIEKLSPDVEKRIYKSHRSKLKTFDLAKFEKQYGKICISTISTFHDRFIILDNELCYALGTSLNSIGKRIFAVNKIETKEIIDAIVNRLN